MLLVQRSSKVKEKRTKKAKKICHDEFHVTCISFFHGWTETELNRTFFLESLFSLLLKWLHTSGRTASDRPRPINDDRLGNSNGMILCNVTRQPRATPSVNYVSSEWSYMLANASFFFSSSPQKRRYRWSIISVDSFRSSLIKCRWITTSFL